MSLVVSMGSSYDDMKIIEYNYTQPYKIETSELSALVDVRACNPYIKDEDQGEEDENEEYSPLEDTSETSSISVKPANNNSLSIQFTVHFKHEEAGDELYFGNTVGYDLEPYLPHGWRLGFKVLKWVDPTLETNIGETKLDPNDPHGSWLLGRALTSFNEIEQSPLREDGQLNFVYPGIENLDYPSKDNSLTSSASLAQHRNKTFAPPKHSMFSVVPTLGIGHNHTPQKSEAAQFVFSPKNQYTFSFHTPYLIFSPKKDDGIKIRLPGFSLDVHKYLTDASGNGQECRYVLCRKRGSKLETLLVVRLGYSKD
ncbi:hypothetical protein NADFUDRAFT_84621 [Nadsonia fulvescens var. elongata DSM 6958]|uniref:Domain of unknown function at the cortex 1 domain-containing protein n=1 Tax=Nadsonia fulvescens var. elongata DSM 6958 TaxID=857566 RepID=A0A1E3PCQ1_9ASCO|nr:hypothetical protein NADFUDRAFT_84621 [Nadsonia fulvescens var. elongata DSM 6958]